MDKIRYQKSIGSIEVNHRLPSIDIEIESLSTSDKLYKYYCLCQGLLSFKKPVDWKKK